MERFITKDGVVAEIVRVSRRGNFVANSGRGEFAISKEEFAKRTPTDKPKGTKIDGIFDHQRAAERDRAWFNEFIDDRGAWGSRTKEVI